MLAQGRFHVKFRLKILKLEVDYFSDQQVRVGSYAVV